jgi:hypothetical protein
VALAAVRYRLKLVYLAIAPESAGRVEENRTVNALLSNVDVFRLSPEGHRARSGSKGHFGLNAIRLWMK